MEARNWTTIKQYEDILFDFYNGIARITINRPRYRNAFTPLTVSEISDALYHCRENGDIYVGVVGPVRTGKSTFIKRFMELLVLPGMEDEAERERTRDELPQSGAGQTIMTTQPKFVPNEAARVTLKDEAAARVRLVDCVGYLIPGAQGLTDGGEARMVRTPWYDYDIPFEEAAG